MPDIPLQFRWEVAQDGYRWLESPPSRGATRCASRSSRTAVRSAPAASDC
jgi:hypothetical protein